MGMQKDWDKQAGKNMWEAGRGDAEIAKAMGVTQGTISYFRRKHWEPEAVAAEAVEEIPMTNNHDSDADTSNDVEAPAAEDGPAPVDLTIEVPECEMLPVDDVDQNEPAAVQPSMEVPGASRTEDVSADYPELIHALEVATENLTGMDAVMTAQIISGLWGWTNKKDLLEAKACLDYLIRRHDRA